MLKVGVLSMARGFLREGMLFVCGHGIEMGNGKYRLCCLNSKTCDGTPLLYLREGGGGSLSLNFSSLHIFLLLSWGQAPNARFEKLANMIATNSRGSRPYQDGTLRGRCPTYYGKLSSVLYRRGTWYWGQANWVQGMPVPSCGKSWVFLVISFPIYFSV